MNLFDIIGPIMIGPSSSHTAGAVRIGVIAGILLGEPPEKVNITLYGSFAKTGKGHGTDKALLAGICGYGIDDIRIKSVFDTCPFEYHFDYAENSEYHPNTAVIALYGSLQSVIVRGASVGAGRIEIQEINGMPVSFSGEFNTLIVFHTDIKGIIAGVTTRLSDNGVNIASMKVFRLEKGGKAIAVIETDQKVDDYKDLESLHEGLRVAYYENTNV